MKRIYILALILIGVSSVRAQTYNADSLFTLVQHNMTDSDLTSTNMNKFTCTMFRTIDKVIDNPLWRERIKADFAVNLISQSMLDMQDIVNRTLNAVHTDSLVSKVVKARNRQVAKYGHLFPGKPAPWLGFIDKEGKHYVLSDFKGKLLYIDVWGTWCTPCIEEFPYLRKLQRHFANCHDIIIMSIACDKDSDHWKAFINKRSNELIWKQYFIEAKSNKRLDDVYLVTGIPRFIVIGKDGNIINPDCIRPSDSELIPYLEKELHKEQ